MLKKIFINLARATIRKYKPIIIAVAGSRRTAETRNAIFAALKNKYYVRTAEPDDAYDAAFGGALAVLGFSHQGRNLAAWFWRIANSFVTTYLIKTSYPDVLILEYPIDKQGQMSKIISLAGPTIGVFTDYDEVVGDGNTSNENPVIGFGEMAALAEALPVNGWAIINQDDYALLNLKQRHRAHPVTFGTEPHADVHIKEYGIHTTKDRFAGDVPEGMIVSLAYGGETITCRLHGAIGKSHAYAAAGASATGLVLNMNLLEISEALHSYVPPPGRTRLVRGIKDSLIIDASHDATPDLMRSNLTSMSQLPAQRKIAVLGDILGIDRLSEQVHRSIGDLAGEHLNLLIAVGPRAKFMADEAETGGEEGEAGRLSPDQVFRLDDAESAGRTLDPLIKPGDLIFVSGSRHMRLEKAVYEIMAQPERARELLVRQGGNGEKD